jgi:hypothetical protein
LTLSSAAENSAIYARVRAAGNRAAFAEANGAHTQLTKCVRALHITTTPTRRIGVTLLLAAGF